jgi:uncharacterized SAM-binding protein YcdF (DUF218 family)
MASLKTAVRTRRIKSAAVRLAILIVVLLALGFAGFAWLVVPSKGVVLDRTADGIVVLTGGTSRVTDALELLAAHRGKRLLITGVNPGTTTVEIGREFPKYENVLASVDLDYSAINTRGNAMQARVWATHHSFHSLIVVTSSYHMPRALAELGHQLPDATLIPFPVVTDRLRVEQWWSSGATTRLVLSEYIKYLFAEMRMRFDTFAPDTGGDRISDVRPL